ncbi:hypothetical protein GCM10010211_82240 [Streptomyces albospinus]|uniref:Glycine cleavage system H protein n=1 Tax=Streptomyces albospinus TaxID=285515 RepID=A0ABQ2VPA0_9ACTN|nr:hypothetical protein GCM10010211_82240 [Streptomyces albospinus]
MRSSGRSDQELHASISGFGPSTHHPPAPWQCGQFGRGLVVASIPCRSMCGFQWPVNTDPYGDGWLFELQVDDAAKLDAILEELLDAAGYEGVIGG